jgi:hypothetical protein
MHAVKKDNPSHYDILRVEKDAQPQQIERAYRRIKAEMQKETTPPDPRLRVLVEQAHDVLSDPARREAYDKQYFAAAAQIDRARRSPVGIAAFVVAIGAVGAAAWMALRPAPPTPVIEARPKKEIQQSVSMAVGRVTQVGLDGRDAPLGVAFSIAEGTLVTACEGISPNTELRVHFGKRLAPVRVTDINEATGLCKLTGGDVGSWPLPFSKGDARPGEGIYAVAVARDNEPRLVDARFRMAKPNGDIRSYEADVAAGAQVLGAPLLDRDGGILGAAARVEGKMAYMSVPRSFMPYKAPPPAAVVPQPEPEFDTAPEVPPGDRVGGQNITPERRQRLEKAFRPPPTVPKDL